MALGTPWIDGWTGAARGAPGPGTLPAAADEPCGCPGRALSGLDERGTPGRRWSPRCPRRRRPCCPCGTSVAEPSAPSTTTALSGAAEDLPGGDVVDHEQVAALAGELGARVGRARRRRRPRSRRRSRPPAGPGARLVTSSASTSGLRTSGTALGSAAEPFLSLVAATVAGRKSATAAAITTTSASGRLGQHGRAQLLGRADRDDADAERRGQVDVGRDQHDLGAAGGGHPGQRPALLARRAVAQVAHRVQRLAGAAGADHDAPAGQVVARARPRRARSTTVARAAMSAGSGSRPGPESGPVSRPTAGGSDDGAAAAQRGDVVLGGGVQPHLGVHRRHEDHRTGRGEQRGGEQVVGPAHGGAGQQVGGGRGDDDEVGALPDPHVRDLGDVGPDVGGDRVARQRLEGGGADEVQRAGRRDDADVVPRLGEARAARRRPCRRPLPR